MRRVVMLLVFVNIAAAPSYDHWKIQPIFEAMMEQTTKLESDVNHAAEKDR